MPFIRTIIDCYMQRGDSTPYQAVNGARGVFCDWLEERGDLEFAQELRRKWVGIEIINTFCRWVESFGFTPTLELFKDAQKLRLEDPVDDPWDDY